MLCVPITSLCSPCASKVFGTQGGPIAIDGMLFEDIKWNSDDPPTDDALSIDKTPGQLAERAQRDEAEDTTKPGKKAPTAKGSKGPPKSGFVLYMKEKLADYPKMSDCARAWHTLSDNQKKDYCNRCKELLAAGKTDEGAKAKAPMKIAPKVKAKAQATKTKASESEAT